MRRFNARSNFVRTLNASRSGASLIEVMMATLVMGVGVLAVMALFPIAYLRAIQASQLTNARLLKKQTEVAVELYDLTSDLYIPQPTDGNTNRCIIDPLGAFNGLDPNYGHPAAFELYTPDNPNPSYFDVNGNITPDGGIPLRRLSFVDNTYANPYNAGFDSLSPVLIPDVTERVLDAVGLTDRFDSIFTVVPSGSTPLQVTFDHNEVDVNDLASLAALTLADTRVVLLDISGKQSQVRTPTLITPDTGSGTGTIEWGTSLPDSMGAVAECRVEIPDRRFTWMLTVRKFGSSGQSTTEVDCVIFHNRPVADEEEELVHIMEVVDSTIPIVDVTFRNYPTDPTLTPPLRKGGYVFDPAHARWYRVLDIDEDPPSGADVRLTLDSFLRETAPDMVLTIPRGVVAVYPLTLTNAIRDGRP